MKAATIKKVLSKAESMNKDYGLGFRRLASLPTETRRAFNLICFSEGIEVSDVHSEQKEFLGELTNEEFITWLKVN